MDDPAARFRAAIGSLSPAGRSVLRTVLTRGPLSRWDIAVQTDLSLAAVTRAVSPLVEIGLLADVTEPQSDARRGRPPTTVTVMPCAMFVVGIKVTADELVGVVTDLQAHVIISEHAPIGSHEPDSVAQEIESLLGRLTARADGPVAALGVSVSGDVDARSGVVRESGLLHWHGTALRRLLERSITVPVVVENDVHALMTFEHLFGIGAGTSSFALVTIGAGIGSGLHLGGEVLEGSFGVAGELGHIAMADPDAVCSCGRRGCVETIASTDAIRRAVSEAHGKHVTYQESVELARSGDPAAIAVFDRASTVLGRAIAALINLLGPERVIISGEAAIDFELFETALRATVHEHAFGAAAQSDIVVRPHTFDDWARGAAATAILSLVS